MKRSLLPLSLLPAILLSAQAGAQSFIVPANRGFDEAAGFDSLILTSSTGRRVVQVFDAAALGFSDGDISAIEFRFSSFYAQGWQQLQDVTISMGVTSLAPDALPTTFSAIPSSPLTTVFQGTVDFPASTTRVIPEPWTPQIVFDTPFSYDASQGNLVLDITSTPSGALAQGWSGEVHTQTTGGAYYQILGNGCGINFTSQLISGIDELVPGGRMWFSLSLGQARNLSGLSYLGLGLPPVYPFDLSGIGASGCELESELAVVQPFDLTATLWTSNASVTWQLPNDPIVVGAALVHQAFVVDNTANALGLNFAQGHRFFFGSATATVPAPLGMVVGEPGGTVGLSPFGPGESGGYVVRFAVAPAGS